MSDLREARDRLRRVEQSLESVTIESPHSPRKYLGKVVTALASGVAPPVYVDTNPVQLSGNMIAGGLASTSVDTSRKVPVLILGNVPTVGQIVVAKTVQGRWVAYLPGVGIPGTSGGTERIPLCFCETIPDTLTMTSADPACNYRMFQSCTITWQATPAYFAPLNLGSHSFISIESFPDPIVGGDAFYYYFTCQYNQFSITRLYPTSPYGTPYRDGNLYTWLLGGYGNTCVPFRLHNGTAFSGSDLSCSVTIDGA
jgi:hypothetical protein